MNKGFIDWLKRESPDVICLQEIKANKEQVEISEIENLGYNTFWFSAQKKGYSGVAIFSKQKPNHVEYGSGIDYMDFEGRIIRLDFDKVSIISLYLPSGTNLDRLDFKFKFMDDFKDYIYQLNNEIKKHPQGKKNSKIKNMIKQLYKIEASLNDELRELE